mmetsp:Transcript_751/g.1599  ORF Transcript_751/g.1599 Transcript_751/m.1599 type:complete len:378 (-) Transcript_751:4228-5361(-)
MDQKRQVLVLLLLQTNHSTAPLPPALLCLLLGILDFFELHLPPRDAEPPARPRLPVALLALDLGHGLPLDSLDVVSGHDAPVGDGLDCELLLAVVDGPFGRLHLGVGHLSPRLLVRDEFLDLDDGVAVRFHHLTGHGSLLLACRLLRDVVLFLPLFLQPVELPRPELHLDLDAVGRLGHLLLELPPVVVDDLLLLLLEVDVIHLNFSHLHGLVGLQAAPVEHELGAVLLEVHSLDAEGGAKEPVVLLRHPRHVVHDAFPELVATAPELLADGVPSEPQPPDGEGLAGGVQLHFPLLLEFFLPGVDVVHAGDLGLPALELPLPHPLGVALHLLPGVGAGEHPSDPLSGSREPLGHHLALIACGRDEDLVKHHLIILLV